MKSVMPKNPFEAYLLIGGPEKGKGGKLAMAFIPLVGVWIFFLIISILGCLCYVCCCACDCCCPLCQCCRRDYDKKPITGAEVNVCLIFLIIFSAPLFIIGIWGMAASSEIPEAMTTMQCAMVSFPHNLLKGVSTSNGGKWIGIVPLATELADVSTNL